MRYFFLVFFLCSNLYYVSAQNISKMDVWQDSLVDLGTAMYHNDGEAERLENNFSFIKTLVSSLKEPNSYYYTFEKLKMISILEPDDKSFRIFSWNIPLHDGSYLYYGAIQFRLGSLKLVPLLDKTFELSHPAEDIVPANKWYGAQYYDIIPLSKGKYALLGWKGHHAEYTKKVIEILTVSSSNELTFGDHIFSDNSKLSRKIFSYTKQATMHLKFNKTDKRIEFDHIVPINNSFKDNYKYYAPDLSYDGYKLTNSKLKFEENIQINNSKSLKDEEYIDPKKGTTKLKSGIVN